jgi:hypothetical protein
MWALLFLVTIRGHSPAIYLVLAMVPVVDPASFIGLRGNGLTPLKINNFPSEQSL